MAPVQNHFTIVPNPPLAINGNFGGGGGGGGKDGSSLPFAAPMTTKQVKKAYQKKTKVPKLSKAEQRRQELFEQDRIRREFEKEKNQARARLARDRKREKEEKERAEKKKKGLPLVEVHPSQDTISRFLRGNSRKESSIDPNADPHPHPNPKVPEPPKNLVSRNAGDSDTDSGTLSGGDGDEDRDEEPPPKKQRIEPSPQCDPVPTKCSPEVAVEELVQVTSNSNADTVTNDAVIPQAELVYDVDDTLEQELISQQLLSESIQAPSSPPKEHKAKEEKAKDDKAIEGGVVESESMPPKLPEVPSSHALKRTPQPQAAVPSQPTRPEKQPRQPIDIDHSLVPADVQTKETGKDVAPRIARRALQDLPTMEMKMRDNITPLKPRSFPAKPTTTTTQQPAINSPKHMFRKPAVPVSASRLSPRPQNVALMGPPPRPPKFKSPARPPARAAGVNLNRPKFISKVPQSDHQRAGAAHIGQGSLTPPSSTQQFMMNHLDDFFPSPSQEVRELYDEPLASSRAGHSQAMSISQESMGMSSPSIRKIQPSKAPMLPDASSQARRSDSQNTTPKPAAQNITRNNQTSLLATDEPYDVLATKGAVDIPFFSTQDLILSQDWMDPKDDLDPSPETQKCDGGASAEGSNTSKVELPLVHGTGVESKSKSLTHNVTNIEGHYRPNHPPRNPTSHIGRSGRGSAKEENNSDNVSITGNADHSSSKSRDNSKSRNPAAEQCYVSLSNVGGSNGVTLESAENTKPALQSTSTPTPPDERSEQPPSKRVSGTSTHPIDSHNAAALPQWSPKPLFASTNRDFRSKYLIERNKTAVWEGSSARRKVQEAMDQFNREEEEAAERLLMEYVCESQELPAAATTPITTPDPATTTTAVGRPSNSGQPPPPLPSRSPDERPKKQTVNQLSCPPPTTPTTAKRGTPTTRWPSHIRPDSMQNQQKQPGSGGQRRPISRPGGSYEEMLALLEQQQLKKSPQAKKTVEGGAAALAPDSAPPAPAPPAASQETDYGDVELDDELYGFL